MLTRLQYPLENSQRKGEAGRHRVKFSTRRRAPSIFATWPSTSASAPPVSATRGILIVIRTQPNAWIHLVATLAVLLAGKLLNVSRGEWIALIFAIGIVWTAEALNTALEFLADEVSLERRERLGIAKDVGAGGVLLASITAAIIGLLIFLPHALALIER